MIVRLEETLNPDLGRMLSVYTKRYCLSVWLKRWAWPYLYRPRWCPALFGGGPIGVQVLQRQLRADA